MGTIDLELEIASLCAKLENFFPQVASKEQQQQQQQQQQGQERQKQIVDEKFLQAEREKGERERQRVLETQRQANLLLDQKQKELLEAEQLAITLNGRAEDSPGIGSRAKSDLLRIKEILKVLRSWVNQEHQYQLTGRRR